MKESPNTLPDISRAQSILGTDEKSSALDINVRFKELIMSLDGLEGEVVEGQRSELVWAWETLLDEMLDDNIDYQRGQMLESMITTEHTAWMERNLVDISSITQRIKKQELSMWPAAKFNPSTIHEVGLWSKNEKNKIKVLLEDSCIILESEFRREMSEAVELPLKHRLLKEQVLRAQLSDFKSELIRCADSDIEKIESRRVFWCDLIRSRGPVTDQGAEIGESQLDVLLIRIKSIIDMIDNNEAERNLRMHSNLPVDEYNQELERLKNELTQTRLEVQKCIRQIQRNRKGRN